MRKTLTLLAALAGALVLTFLAASPASAATNRTIVVNDDNGIADFVGDASGAGQELVKACDTKADGYDVIGLVDLDGDGVSNVHARTTKGNGYCYSNYFEVPEGKQMTFWACQIKGDNFVNCSSRYTVWS